MELPFEKTVSRFWQQKLYAPVIREETQEYKLPEGMPDIERVIAAWGQVVLRGKEWRSHHIGLTGGVMVWAIYAAADGTLRRIESWMPFSARTEHSHDGEEGVIRAECVLSGVDARTASSRKLMLRCQLGLLVQTMVLREATIYAPGELPGDIEVLERTYPMILTRETGEKSFLCEERLELPQGTGTIEQLLYYRLTPRVTEQKVLGSRAVFRGTGMLHLLCREEGGRLRSLELELPFAQYLDLEGDYEEGAEVSNLLAVTSLEAEPTDDGGIQVRCGLVSQYIINAPTVIRCLEDAYSPLRELELVREEVRLPAWLDEQVRQVELQERLAGEGVPVDQIFFPDLPQVSRQPGGAEIRVSGCFQALWEEPDGTLSAKNARSGKSVTLLTECDTIPFTRLSGPVHASREGSGWSMEAGMALKLDSICTSPISMVSSIRAGELREPDPDRPSVIVRASRSGESLWDIAKYCGSTVSAIQRLNKLEREPEENRLLLIPVI